MLVDDLFKSVYKKKQTDLILLDFSKAFDKVSHEKLALKLHDYGIIGPALKWVNGFLVNRHQSVIVNGFSSIRAFTCLIWSTSGVCARTTSLSNLHK